ncbi:polymorphic toxin-type HINT domain-containing protein [Desulfonema ishimotonii]|nr:polymorphic toxin-type HINT domain-containing protein [Desulfonema ishimotonii]
MTACDGATYTWNAENRLIAAETADRKITFLYDYMGRRVRKQVYSGTPGSWNALPDETRVFVYNGWNLIRETVTGTASGETYYVWGFDLSQFMQGAGGIGGLLCSVSGGEVRRYTYDANGNVGQLVDESGVIVAHYEYDPFGNEIRADGAGAQDNPFRFSTKYLDAETGFYYYGFRYYVPKIGRWINRDPLGEEGGYNLYAFVFNNSFAYVDPFGMQGLSDYIYKIHDHSKKLGAYHLTQMRKALRTLDLAGYLLNGFNAAFYNTASVFIPENDDEMFLALVTFDMGPAMGEGLIYIARGSKGLYYKFFKKCGDDLIEVAPKELPKEVARTIPRNLSKAAGKQGCFVAGTPVRTIEGLRFIEDIEADDFVLARDTETGEFSWRKVVRTFVRDDQQIIELKLEGENGTKEKIGATVEHPFWVKDRGWIGARELLPGDEVFTSKGGWLKVTGSTWLSGKQAVYNFEVDGLHNYFVGETGAWVHNESYVKISKEASLLRTGGNDTTVNVKTKAEADKLLKEAFPDYQKVNGVGPQDTSGIRKKRSMDRFKQGGAYHKDYAIDPKTGGVRGYDSKNIHGKYPHVNIKRRDKKKVLINITGK